MTRGRLGVSLFWTIAAMFSLAVVLGTVVQVFLALAVLRPIEEREARARAGLAAAGLAAEIASLPGVLQPARLDSLIGAYRAGLGPHPAWIVFRSADRVIAGSPASRTTRLGGALSGPVVEGRLPGTGAPGTPDRFQVVARSPVRRGPELLGEVLAVQPMRPRGLPRPLEPRTLLLFLPIALMLAAVLALLSVRPMVRRLRAMEKLATRVAEGDLSVRIGDPRGDELGRLAGQLDRMTERLAESRASLEENERQRRQLLADITHELATPLTSIRGYAETLLDPSVPLSQEGRTRYVRGVVEESRRLDRLIRDLFDLARLEAGASTLAREPLNWAGLCRNTTERFGRRFEEAGIRLAWRQSPDEAWIEADGHRMEQVLENLLVNALRYVPSGCTVEVSLARAPGDPDRFRLVVSDDGPGIPPAELPLVFERFYRGAGAGARDEAGSGLGLAIVRAIVEQHEGTAHAEASPSNGLSIIIELPARA